MGHPSILPDSFDGTAVGLVYGVITVGAMPDLGRVGVWTWSFDGQPFSRVRDAVTELDELGFGGSVITKIQVIPTRWQVTKQLTGMTPRYRGAGRGGDSHRGRRTSGRFLAGSDKELRSYLGFGQQQLYVDLDDLPKLQAELAKLLEPYQSDRGGGKRRVSLGTALIPEPKT